MIEGKDFYIRCSMVGTIMVDPKGELPLSKGTITYLENWLYEEMTGEQIFQGNAYTQKGWEVEDAAIDDYAKLTDYKGLVKNEEFYYNNYAHGTPDVLVGNDLVVDIKSPWSLDTFNKYATHSPTEERPCPNASYFWQLQAYMLLTGRQQAELAYVLKNTPQHLLDRMNQPFIDYEAVIPLEKRVKIFGVKRSNSHISRIEERVDECRDYLDKVIIPNNI